MDRRLYIELKVVGDSHWSEYIGPFVQDFAFDSYSRRLEQAVQNYSEDLEAAGESKLPVEINVLSELPAGVGAKLLTVPQAIEHLRRVDGVLATADEPF